MATTQSTSKTVPAVSTPQPDPLVTIASESVAIDTFDSPNGQGFEEWRVTTDLVLDTLRLVSE